MTLFSLQRSGRAFVAPRDEVEARVAEIFQEVLSVSPIGVNDDFFELGGQSMLGVRARDMFATRTVLLMTHDDVIGPSDRSD